MRNEENLDSTSLELHDERACAYQKTKVFLRQAYPNGAVAAYDQNTHRHAEHLLLVKFVVGIGEKEPRWITYQECSEETTADNIPGGLKSRVITSNGERFEVSYYPLLLGEYSTAYEGGALLHIHSDTQLKFWLKFGNGNLVNMHFSPVLDIAGEKIDCEEGNCKIEDEYIMVHRKDRSVITAVHGDLTNVKIAKLLNSSDGYGIYTIAECIPHSDGSTNNGTDIYVMVGFAEDALRARMIAGKDPLAEKQAIHDYYNDLLEHWHLETPDKELNEAFDHALLNVEYSWFYPYGWIESFHHWPTMWHMEHTAAEEWNGRYDRVRSCLRSQMKDVFENGAIPDMCPNGERRRDWGGNNQFFFREVEHYVKMTGDLEFAAEAEPFLENALKQTFKEYDPAGSGIIGWGTQIANQEDFESTPGKGAATGIEGVRMLEIMAYIKQLLGKTTEADRYAASADSCRDIWYKTLWLSDVGRPAWYEDIYGKMHLDTTYHGIIYPVLYNAINDQDKISALDHLRHRLTGPEGEIYQSNHFGDHLYDGMPTWGMQCGSDMQPFATAAYASVGMKKEAIQPLTFIARRVCGEFQRGSWPETANEKRFAYFSPSAAVFSQGIIESVFGLKRDIPANVTTITPAIPTEWPGASLRLPQAQLTYTNVPNGFSLKISIPDNTMKKVCVLCPPSLRITAKIADRTITVIPQHHCGWSSAEFEVGTEEDIFATFVWEPIAFCCNAPAIAACGQPWSVTVSGDVSLVGIDDRCGVLKQLQWGDNEVSGYLRSDLLKPYESYGWFGKINFARRMVYLRLKAQDQVFLYPCPVTVLPAFHIRAKADYGKNRICLEVFNQTKQDISGSWKLLYQGSCLTAEGNIPANQKGELFFSMKDCLMTLSPGKNQFMLTDPITQMVTVEADVANAHVVNIPLPADKCQPADYWREIGIIEGHGHLRLAAENELFMKNLWEEYPEIPVIPNVPLCLNSNGFVPFSTEKHPLITISLNSKRIKKLYILCSAFIDNHNQFSKIMKIEVEAKKGDAFIRPIYHYDCYFPGDLDIGFGNKANINLSTFSNDVSADYVPDFPFSEDAQDYPEIQPPLYPQRNIWRTGRAVECCNTVFNLLEFDFCEFTEMKELRIITDSADVAGGIFAIAAHII